VIPFVLLVVKQQFLFNHKGHEVHTKVHKGKLNDSVELKNT